MARPWMDDEFGGEGYPAKLHVYDRTGQGDIDTLKSIRLAEYLKADPSGADKIAAYTNQLVNASTRANSFTSGMPGGNANLVSQAQDMYLAEMDRMRSGGIRGYKTKKR